MPCSWIQNSQYIERGAVLMYMIENIVFKSFTNSRRCAERGSVSHSSRADDCVFYDSGGGFYIYFVGERLSRTICLF